MKETFIFSISWADILSKFDDRIRLEVYDAIVLYQKTGNVPKLSDTANMAFSFIRMELDKNNDRWEQIRQKRVESGRLGALKTNELRQKSANDGKSRQVSASVGKESASVGKSGCFNNVNNYVINDVNNINNNKKEILKKKDFDFIKEDFKPLIEDWLTYKKERRESYKSVKTIKIFYENLISLSGGDYLKAKKIIEQSIGNNWAGIFALKTNTNPETKYDNSIDKDYGFEGFQHL